MDTTRAGNAEQCRNDQSERSSATAQELADYTYALHPADDAFWTVKPGDPGPDNQFDAAVYDRGALALQALRNRLGDATFFALLEGWPAEHAYGNAIVSDFVTYAERVTGTPLAGFFDTWPYQPSRPEAPTSSAARTVQGAGQPASWRKIAATNTIHDRD